MLSLNLSLTWLCLTFSVVTQLQDHTHAAWFALCAGYFFFLLDYVIPERTPHGTH